MHHVRRPPRIYETADSYDIIYTVEPEGKEIKINIPRYGVLEHPEREVTRDLVENVARRVGEALRDNLSSELGRGEAPASSPDR